MIADETHHAGKFKRSRVDSCPGPLSRRPAQLGINSCPAFRSASRAVRLCSSLINTQSVSYVEIAKIGTPSPRRGSMNAANIPTSEKENGPSSFRQIQPPSHACCGGTLSSGHTTESSWSVRVIENSEPIWLHAGIVASAGKRHTPNFPGRHRNFSFMIF